MGRHRLTTHGELVGSELCLQRSLATYLSFDLLLSHCKSEDGGTHKVKETKYDNLDTRYVIECVHYVMFVFLNPTRDKGYEPVSA